MKTIIVLIFLLSAGLTAAAQVGRNVELMILKAEDTRRFNADLEKLLTGRNEERLIVRALLASGRIGDERAVTAIAPLVKSGSLNVREMAAFALGEIESIKAADVIIETLRADGLPDSVRARAVEAAGKIAAANANPVRVSGVAENPKVVELGDAILDTLEAEESKRANQNKLTVMLGLTAALRARPEGGDTVVALFLTNLDPRVRSDAANTLARLRTKSANPALRAMLMSDDDASARANAARALGAAEDKEAVNLLIDAATEDLDPRVRITATRTLATLKDPYAVERLLNHGEKLLAAFSKGKRAGYDPVEKSELLEIATVLGRLIPKTNDARTVKFLTALGTADRYRSPETEIAFARIAAKKYTEYLVAKDAKSKAAPRAVDAALLGIRELASLGASEEETAIKNDAVEQLRRGLARFAGGGPSPTATSIPELLQSLAVFKADGYERDIRESLKYDDPIIRSTAAQILEGLPAKPENIDALEKAFERSLLIDKKYNDAQLAILDAIFTLDKKRAVPSLVLAANAHDHLVRQRAALRLADKDLQNIPEAAKTLKNLDRGVTTYKPGTPTKLGQALNTDADYRRALARKNGSLKAVLATQKGTFAIDLLPENAPLTVDNFVKLARSGYFNGLEVHRVVPNFVMQDGDPRGDGNGGPGWSIRCEVNMVPYERGAVGMALSGKDTGGSQWFVTHSPQPHLDGGYTVFGKVNETDMKVVDKIVRGDKILSVRIVEAILPQRTQRARRTEARAEPAFFNPLFEADETTKR